MFSCPSDTFSLLDRFEEIDDLLALRGGFAASVFSGDPSLLMFKAFSADLVRFLPGRSAGLDDSSPVPGSFDAGVVVSIAVVGVA